MCYFMCLIVCLMLRSSNAEMGQSMRGMSEMLHTMCPGVNICHENQTYDTASVEFASGFTICCDGNK